MSSSPVTPGVPSQAPITVLIVNDSHVQRRFLRGAIADAPELEIVGEARNGREAIGLVERLRPATVLMDLDVPGMNGIEAIERIMASRPTPIVVYSRHVDDAQSANAIAALAAGAVDVVAKPTWGEGGHLEAYALDLRNRLRVAARVKVITHPRGRLRAAATALTAPARALARSRADRAEPDGAAEGVPGVVARTSQVRLVAIGASTGGPQAVATVLSGLPADFEPAVLVVQHMADGFIPGLVAWLNQISPLPVVQGQTGRRLQPGVVTIAPSGLNLLVRDHLRVVCEPAPERQFHVPGIDASFSSVAETLREEAVGVLLTGMGRDGAAGLKTMRERGASTIGQDEESSAVYGMPAAALSLDAVEYQLPLSQIAPALIQLASGGEGG